MPVILDPQLVVWKTNEQTNAEEMKVAPAIFYKAGIGFQFPIYDLQLAIGKRQS